MFIRADKATNELRPATNEQAGRSPRARVEGQGYEAQRAELSPRTAPPAQEAKPEAAPVVPAATVEGAPTGGVQAAPSPGETALVDELHRYAYDWLRKQAYSLQWMTALQTALRVSPTGIADVDTVNAILARHPIAQTNDPKAKTQKARERQANRNEVAAQREMAAALKELSAGFPDPKLPAHASAEGLGKAGGAHRAGPGTPEDLAFQTQGGYAGYVTKQLKSGRFLGQPVLAHPEMHDRLANATAYLKAKFPNATTDADLAAAVGVHTVISFRATSPTFDQMYHGLGFAIDLNPAQNNWQMGRHDNTWQLNRFIGNANALFGTKELRSAYGMAANSKKKSTEGAYADIAQSNAQLKRYRVLANDRAKLEAYLASAECPEDVRKLGIEHWVKVLAKDEKQMADPAMKLVGANGKSDHEAGFMDLKLETVQALRDAGGLRWAGTDGGGDSGDLMHFDGGFIPTAHAMRAKVDKARKQLAEAKASVATDKEKVGG